MWQDGIGEVIFRWDPDYIGCFCITRIWNDDGSEDITCGVIDAEKTNYSQRTDPYVRVLAPNEPLTEDRYWWIKWSALSGNIMRLDFRTVKEDLGINVCDYAG